VRKHRPEINVSFFCKGKKLMVVAASHKDMKEFKKIFGPFKPKP
jgi:hypothetical protein